jgi:hypothetical protein
VRAFATVMSGWRRLAPAGRLGPADPRRLRATAHARRLAALLAVVRRPGRVAEARGLLRGGQLEQRSSDPAASSMPAAASPRSAKRAAR